MQLRRRSAYLWHLGGAVDVSNLFQTGKFKLHAGGFSEFKIDCDALTDDDIQALAREISHLVSFREVVGIPSGGDRLAAALQPYCDPNTPVLLIVDDVCTTGKSMRDARQQYASSDLHIAGVVIFAREPCPPWVMPLFQMVS